MVITDNFEASNEITEVFVGLNKIYRDFGLKWK